MSDTDRSNPEARAEVQPEEPGKGKRKGATPTPHDALFRALLAGPDQAQALLRDQLPNEIAGKLADKPPRIVDRSFIDEKLRGSQLDLLLKVETVSGESAFLYLLGEHKSYSDPGVVFQLARYMILIWEDHAGNSDMPAARPTART